MLDLLTSAARGTVRNGRAALILALGISGFAAAGSAFTTTIPAGFTDEFVTAVGSPTALAFTPDGRLLIATQPGRLWVYDDGMLLGPALNLTSPNVICSNSERGLLGVAVDPSFASNNFIYVYYTFNASGTCVNRVSRYTLSTGNVASGQTVLID